MSPEEGLVTKIGWSIDRLLNLKLILKWLVVGQSPATMNVCRIADDNVVTCQQAATEVTAHTDVL
jgi:hypothetical protein